MRLWGAQGDFVEAPQLYVAFVTGRGGGKTWAGAVKGLRRCLEQYQRSEPCLGLVIAPTYTMAHDVVWRTCCEIWRPWIRRTNTHDLRVELLTGAEVLFRSADNPDRLRGLTCSWAWIDEAAQCDRAVWEVTIATLRQGGRVGPCWLTTTPKGFNWVYDVFVVERTPETCLIQARTADNPFLDPRFAEVLRAQYSTTYAQQELEGEFVALGGGLFPLAWWRRYETWERTGQDQVIQVWDTAFSEKTTADYSVCATWVARPDGYYVLDVWRRQVSFPDLTRAAIDLAAQWRPEVILIENRASGQSLIQELQRETRLPIIPIDVDRDKLSRAHAVSAIVEAGKVFLPQSAPWVRDFIDEHAVFPDGQYDDQVDTTTMALQRLAWSDVGTAYYLTPCPRCGHRQPAPPWGGPRPCARCGGPILPSETAAVGENPWLGVYHPP